MQDYQAGIFTEGSQYHRYYEWVFPALDGFGTGEKSSELDAIRGFVTSLVALQVALDSTKSAAMVVAFSQRCWQRLADSASELPITGYPRFQTADGSQVATAT